jgi:hypothetical protein
MQHLYLGNVFHHSSLEEAGRSKALQALHHCAVQRAATVALSNSALEPWVVEGFCGRGTLHCQRAADLHASGGVRPWWRGLKC